MFTTEICFSKIPDPTDLFGRWSDDSSGSFIRHLRDEWIGRGRPIGDAFEQGWEAMLIQACFSLGMRKTAGLGSEWIAEYLGTSDEYPAGVIEITGEMR